MPDKKFGDLVAELKQHIDDAVAAFNKSPRMDPLNSLKLPRVRLPIDDFIVLLLGKWHRKFFLLEQDKNGAISLVQHTLGLFDDINIVANGCGTIAFHYTVNRLFLKSEKYKYEQFSTLSHLNFLLLFVQFADEIEWKLLRELGRQEIVGRKVSEQNIHTLVDVAGILNTSANLDAAVGEIVSPKITV